MRIGPDDLIIPDAANGNSEYTFGQVRSGTKCATFLTSTDDDGLPYRIYIRQRLSRRRFQQRLVEYIPPDADRRAIRAHALGQIGGAAK